MGSFNTETETMHRAAGHVHQVNDAIGAQLRTLANQLVPLEGAWQGAAATAFHQLMARFTDNAEGLRGALRGIGEQLSGAGGTYAAEDEEQQRAMSAITGALG
jgi:WXG100 family type VII secretion target